MRKQHKEDSSCWGRSFRKSSVRGIIPKESSVRGISPIWEVTFAIDVKGGDIYKMHDTELDAWTEIIEAWFQGE
jgi:hypothetical protein